MERIIEKLEKIVKKTLTEFKQDLELDKDLLKNYKGEFLYAYRENGTNILLLNVNRFDYSLSLSDLEKHLKDMFIILKGNNKHFMFCDGVDLKDIPSDFVSTYFKIFAQRVLKKKRRIDELNIDLISFDLYNLMSTNRQWKYVIKESNISTFIKLREKFNWQKLKKSSDLQEINNQLLSLIKMEN